MRVGHPETLGHKRCSKNPASVSQGNQNWLLVAIFLKRFPSLMVIHGYVTIFWLQELELAVHRFAHLEGAGLWETVRVGV